MHKEEPLAYHAMTAADVVRAVGSRLEGLRDDEVRMYRAMHGVHALPAPRRAGALVIVLRQLRGPFTVVLLLALVVSMALGEVSDAVLLVVILALHTILGFVQEYRADAAFAKLAAYLPQHARVRRNGAVVRVPAEEVVVGDVLVVRAGDRVVADARLLRVEGVEVNEAALTGESMPVAKHADAVAVHAAVADRRSLLFAGTTIAAGTAEAVVVAVGSGTAFGALAGMMTAVAPTATPMQQQLLRFSRRLVWLVLAIVGAVLAWGLASGETLTAMLPLAVALAVAAIPEGLLVLLTIILARTMRRMAARKALVRNLPAAETLGSVTVICTDKTGTLTEGSMSVTTLSVDGELVTPGDAAARALLEAMALTQHTPGSHTEEAIARYAAAHGVHAAARRIATLPFDAARAFSATLYTQGTARCIVALGAPDVLLAHADISDAARGRCAAAIETLSRRGLRVLLVAEREAHGAAALAAEDVRDMRVVGLVGLEDAVRADTAAMVAEAAQAGVRTIMLTGDHPGTAHAVATAIGLPGHGTLTGVEVALLNDMALRERVRDVSIFARIRPEDKLRIVRALQANGETVAMTGDGVNDAPALRAADIGVALGSGTDVAKEAADVILLHDDFATIVVAIREGRGILDTTRKVVAYFMAGCLSEVALVVAALALYGPMPLLPVHILWINVLTDGFAALALAAEPVEREAMREPPRPRREALLRKPFARTTVAVALCAVAGLVAMYAVVWPQVTPELLRSVMFLSLGIVSMLTVYVFRSVRRSSLRMLWFANPSLIVAVLGGCALLLVPFAVPALRQAMQLSAEALLALPYLLALGVMVVTASEAMKFFFVARK